MSQRQVCVDEKEARECSLGERGKGEDMESSTDGGVLKEVLASLPPQRFAFAYGSGAIPQRGIPTRSRMLDFVVAVDSAEQWHADNMTKWGNVDHYSTLMRWLGPRAVSSVQCALGARIYYNTLVPWKDGRTFKYGVITFADLLEDLREWRTLYVSGRLQKPVRILTTDKSIEAANEQNIESAACVALLKLPERFDETRFYETVASLSYTGDLRVRLRAEDPDKISRIVSGNREGFRRLYTPTLKRLRRFVDWDGCGEKATQDMQVEAREALFQRLPRSFIGRMRCLVREEDDGAQAGKPNAALIGNGAEHSTFASDKSCGGASERRSFTKAVVARGEAYYRRALTRALGHTVWQSSSVQALKGVLSAGVVRSASYALGKLSRARG